MLIPLPWRVGKAALERALLIAIWLPVIVVDHLTSAIETIVDWKSAVTAASYPARQGYRLRRVVLRDHSGRNSVVVSVGRSNDLNNNFSG